MKFREQLNRLSGIGEVVFEGVRRHRGVDAAHVYGGLLATLTAWCEEHQIPYDARSVQAIKIFSAGKGNADKAAVITAVEGWGFRPKNDNEADALALLHLRLSETGQFERPIPLPDSRRRLARRA